jgi:hypothetical protein
MARDAIRADNAQCGGARRSFSLLHSGYRQPAGLFGYTSSVRCGDGRVSSGHDRRSANGEMDGGGYRGGRHRRPYAGRDGNPQGSLHCLDRRSRQFGDRDRGARRGAADILSGPSDTGCVNRLGNSVFMAGDTLTSPAVSGIAFKQQPKIDTRNARNADFLLQCMSPLL